MASRRFHLQRIWTLRAAMIATVLCIVALPGLGADPPIGWPEPDPETGKIPFDAFTIERGSGPAPPATAPLLPCDNLKLSDTSRRVRFTFVNSTRLLLDREHPTGQAPCKGSLLSDAATTVLRSISGGFGTEQRAATKTRGDDLTTLALPVFMAERSLIAEGRRALYLTWQGGTPPFTIELSDAATHARVTTVNVVRNRFVKLDEVDLRPGRYSISVRSSKKDAAGNVGLAEDNLFVVPANQVPAAPAALVASHMGAGDKALLYAYFLEAFGDGRWTFEALQQASASDTPAAREYLQRFGDAP